MITLIKLTENDKKLLIALLLVVILLFVIIGYISLLVKRIMEKQGSKSDDLLRHVVNAKYFNKEKDLLKFGIRKNMRTLYMQARVPFIILILAWIGLFIYCLFTGNWSYNVFNKYDGFGTLIWKLGVWPRTDFFGITIINGWPKILETPHFEWRAIYSYVFVIANAVSIIWFMLCTQAYIARSIRIYQIAHGIFRKKLDAEPAPTSLNE